MTKRLSANAPKPRSRISFPGYPTLAAASLYLCLSSGCSRDPNLNDPSSIAGSTAGGTTRTGGATSTGGYLAGAIGEPFESTVTPADAAAPDVPPPIPDVSADVTEASSPSDAAEAGPALPENSPALAGGISAPYEAGGDR
jgi:hypothetical protein